MIDFDKLSAPFAPERISWRVGSTTADKKRGMALAFIDARDVMERLDAVCGPAGWQDTYPHANSKTVCAIGIKCGDDWVWKSDGAGDTDVEAEKGALSDAFKRAAVRWGIGRYLYDLEAPWVELEPAGKSYKIKESELARLSKLASPRGGGSATTTRPSSPQPERKAVPRAPSDDASPGDWQRWATALVEYARGLKSEAEIVEFYHASIDDRERCASKSVKLSDWLIEQLAVTTDAKRNAA